MEWYRVFCDDFGIHRDVAPPGGDAWSDEVAWSDIVRVCFKPGGIFESDEFYVFSSKRDASYVIPTEASGGGDLVGALVRRDLFSAELLIEAMASEDGLFCWPPVGGGEG
jgi:hypothetical protein